MAYQFGSRLIAGPFNLFYQLRISTFALNFNAFVLFILSHLRFSWDCWFSVLHSSVGIRIIRKRDTQSWLATTGGFYRCSLFQFFVLVVGIRLAVVLRLAIILGPVLLLIVHFSDLGELVYLFLDTGSLLRFFSTYFPSELTDAFVPDRLFLLVRLVL